MASKKKFEPIFVDHEFPPFYDSESEILILGSFPSVKSREQKFYYGHPQNRFWRVLEKVFNAEPLCLLSDKTKFLRENHIALYDVIYSCIITGSSDSSIKNPVPTDLFSIIHDSKVRKILLNGKKASGLFETHQSSIAAQIPHVSLPSTSPANAAISFSDLVEAWEIALKEY